VRTKAAPPQRPIYSQEELQAWKSRMEERIPVDAPLDAVILGAMVATYLYLVGALATARVSLARLKRWLFGAGTEKKSNIFPGESDASGTGQGDGSGGGGASGTKRKGKAGEAKPKKGHGRRPAGAYTGAERIPVVHPTFTPGCSCPDEDCDGKLYRMNRPSEILKFFGQALLIAKIWLQERWRCNLCLEIFKAPLPHEATGPKFDVSAVVNLAVARFGYGIPAYRLEQSQASQGVPFSASVQMAQLGRAYEHLIPVFDELVRQAAQVELLHNDDTGMKVLEILDEIKKSQPASGTNTGTKKKRPRTGMHTTGILAVALTHGHRIALYFTGRQHAGENLADVLKKRDPGLPPPIHESDGLDDTNKPGDIQVIIAKCLTHARRGFVDSIPSFPDQSKYVVDLIGEIYRVDELAKERSLSAEDRLFLHQEKSGPVMEKLRRWLVTQLLEDLVEPNSSLGEAIQYTLRRWEPLTRFLSVPGVPLDNTPCERTLKSAIRHRKNSLFFKSDLNHVDKVHYLTTVLSNIESVRTSPGCWMPWNYQLRVSSKAATADGQTPEIAGDSVPASAADHPVIDQDASVDSHEHITNALASVSTQPAGGSLDFRPVRAPGPLPAAGSVEFKIPRDPGRPESRDETTLSPGPPKPGLTHLGQRLVEARSPT